MDNNPIDELEPLEIDGSFLRKHFFVAPSKAKSRLDPLSSKAKSRLDPLFQHDFLTAYEIYLTGNPFKRNCRIHAMKSFLDYLNGRLRE